MPDNAGAMGTSLAVNLEGTKSMTRHSKETRILAIRIEEFVAKVVQTRLNISMMK